MPERDYYRWRLTPIEMQAEAGDVALVAAPWPARNMVKLLTGIDAFYVHRLEVDEVHLSAARQALQDRHSVYVVFEHVDDDRTGAITALIDRLGPLDVEIAQDAERGVVVLQR